MLDTAQTFTRPSFSSMLAAGLAGSLLGALFLAAAASPAAACPNGYKRVVIQGNSICQIDLGGPTSLKAPEGGGYEASEPSKRAVRRRAELQGARSTLR